MKDDGLFVIKDKRTGYGNPDLTKAASLAYAAMKTWTKGPAMTVNRIIAAMLLGAASLLTAFTFAVASNNIAFTAIMSGLACMGTAIAVLKAPSGRQAWGRGFLGLAATLIVMPFLLASALGQQFDDHTAQSLHDDDTAMSAAIVSSMLVGVSTMFGVFFGAVALVIGLILNRAPAPPWQPPQDMPRG